VGQVDFSGFADETCGQERDFLPKSHTTCRETASKARKISLPYREISVVGGGPISDSMIVPYPRHFKIYQAF
jgi:hypothetical protein